jgi:L-rhamnose isomerase
MDNGHYHPTEVVSVKITSLLLLNKKLALHVTRSVRWDSDHVVRYDDETKEIAKEIVASGRMDDIAMALDFFDASINRIAAWVIGIRSFRKALLSAMLTPNATFTELQNKGEMTKLMALQEEIKMLPIGAVWEEFCARNNVPADMAWLDEVEKYEKEVLSKRG